MIGGRVLHMKQMSGALYRMLLQLETNPQGRLVIDLKWTLNPSDLKWIQAGA